MAYRSRHPSVRCRRAGAKPGGLLDVSLHPRFPENRLIYLTYSKPGRGGRQRDDRGIPGALGRRLDAGRRARHPGRQRLSRRPGKRSEHGPRDGQLRVAARVGQERPAVRHARRSQHRKMAQDPGSHTARSSGAGTMAPCHQTTVRGQGWSACRKFKRWGTATRWGSRSIRPRVSSGQPRRVRRAATS